MSVGSGYLGYLDADHFLALSSTMSRQKETVTSIRVFCFRIKDNISSVDTLITLLKAQKVYVAYLDVDGEIGEEEWQALNRALQGKEGVFGEVSISRKDLKDVRDISIKGIWDATMREFRVHNMESLFANMIMTGKMLGRG